MEQTDIKNSAIVETIEYVGDSAYKALYRRIKKRIDGLVDALPSQIKEWATSTFVKSVNGKSGSEITINKDDVGLGNVDNTADANKSVSHAATADNADTLDSRHAVDFLLKSVHDAYASEVAALITAVDAKKVDKVEGKGLSTNDFTTEEKNKLKGIEEGAQVNDPNTVVDASYVHTDNNYTTEDKNSLKAVIADMENVIAEKDTLIQDMEQAVILERKGYNSVPLLCGQPMILLGYGSPREEYVPSNWRQFDPKIRNIWNYNQSDDEIGDGYNWNGMPSAIGQMYIDISDSAAKRIYVAVSIYNAGDLVWK